MPPTQHFCVYCCSEVLASDLTEDHVLARSWFPAGTPPVAKWKVPCCLECNNKYSKLEGDLLGRLALCLDPKDPETASIVSRAQRSMDPTKGKSHQDVVQRLNRRFSLQKDSIIINNPNAVGVLPSFRENFSQGSRRGILLPAASLEMLVSKWIRGIHFYEYGQIVRDPYTVGTYFVEDEVAYEVFSEVIDHARIVNKGPGIEVMIWRVEDSNDVSSLYAFQIWKRFRVYGSIEIAEDLEDNDEIVK